MDIGTVVFTKTISTGAAAEITLDHVDRFGAPQFRLHLAGAATETVERGTIAVKPREGLYGFGGSRHTAPILGLTAAERDQLEAAMAAVKAETRAAYATTPDGQADQLRQQRRDLVAAVSAAHDAEDRRFSGAHDRQDETAWTGKAAGESTIEAARAALASFDAAHSEIVAEIWAAREAKEAANVAAAWHN